MDFAEWENSELQYILRGGMALFAERTVDGMPVGVIRLTELNSPDGWANYAEWFPADALRTIEAMEASVLALDFAFEQFGVHKLFSEVLAYTGTATERMLMLGFDEEARLREDAWWRDRFHDYAYFGLSRGSWNHRRAGIIARLSVVAEQSE